MAVLRVFSLVPLLSASLIWIYYLIQQAPITENQCTINFLFPKKMDDITKLNSCLKQYYQNNYLYILTLYSSIYIFKQTFCIPGSIILNVLAGSLFGTGYGFLLVCILSSIGVSACYCMSKLCGLEEVITQFLPSQLTSAKISLENLVKKNQDQLWYLLTVLRVIPITPNWLLNLVAPVIKIPLWTFMYTTFFGLMPYNYICCQSGQTLSSINSLDEIFTFKTTLQLMSIAVAMVMIKVASKFCKIQT
ncbi:transmembrane protein 41A-like isoform X2 [Adelges cooleyi]|nr:transmembrane protein 41A-like isoform X2 [Adelges cooleyi]XP_050422814.1 transmembrane protein 41A-like isoform X2 [Adelges cooleyi]XP_050422815.1 transmembrane protein 41A-like isoform X2 [Adelges cooleyi]XP_050422816.1 transmembrane protein 41A-like isoform X2 [Adelges cooleyi]